MNVAVPIRGIVGWERSRRAERQGGSRPGTAIACSEG